MLTPVAPDLPEAVRLLKIYTAGRFDLWAIVGPATPAAGPYPEYLYCADCGASETDHSL